MQYRLSQQEVLSYSSGKMGVSAVPGSGKTFTLSALAANIITSGVIRDDQEVLIVTLVNSAVENFSSRVAEFVKQSALMPDFGYRVRTLHGLAHDIVRERPDLVGLPENFQIIDERESSDLLDSVVQGWLRGHPEFLLEYTADETKLANPQLRRQWGEAIVNLCQAFIRTAKDLQAFPNDIRRSLQVNATRSTLIEMGLEVYEGYQQGLAIRSGVDFDDLIRLALLALKTDPNFLERLRLRWPFILEDEAQDSSRLQEDILRLLCGADGNWVRVGDPNQAIYETFTTASPDFLRNFLHEEDVIARDLPESGRSTESVITLANHLIEWSESELPPLVLQNSLQQPFIRSTSPGDPQPNPTDNPEGIVLYPSALTPEKEISLVARSLARWLPDHPGDTVAVLVPRNERGAQLVEALKEAGIEYIELLRSSLSTRQTANILATIIRTLDDPSSTLRLVRAFQVIHPEKDLPKETVALNKQSSSLLGSCQRLEEYLAPQPEHDWLAEFSAASQSIPEGALQELDSFRSRMARWQAAVLLPIDQLLLTIAQDLFSSPADLALAHKLARALEQRGSLHPEWHLPDFAHELDTIAQNERKFIGFTDEDAGFNPNSYPGKVVVATIHKAKGLEWDRVYLLSVNNYDFPANQLGDSYISEKWFVKGRLNLEAETIAALRTLLNGEPIPLEGDATIESRQEYCAERLRLLFVGITRTKRDLIVTWNTGKRGDCTAAIPLQELIDFWGRSTQT